MEEFSYLFRASRAFIQHGDDESEALERAIDALETMLMGVIEDRGEIPEPGRLRRKDRYVTLPALTEAKVRAL